MAYAPRPDGLMDVSLADGSTMPMALSAQQLEAMGHQPIPPIQAQPRGLPPNAVAGPGGGAPDDMGGADQSIALAAGNGQGPQMTPGDLARLTSGAAPAASRSHASAPSSKFDVPVPADQAGPGALELAAHSSPREGVKQPAAAPGYEQNVTPEDQLVMRQAVGAGAGPVKNVPYLRESKQKYTQYGQVPDQVKAGIDAQQGALDAREQADLNEHHSSAEQVDRERQAQLEQQQRDIQDQRAHREAVNAKLTEFQQARDQREDAVANMKPPEMSDYIGSRSTFSNLMTGISIALGGALQGLRGGTNPGLEMANQAIDRWVGEQKEAYQRKAKGAELANNRYAEALKIYGTPEMAENDLRAQGYAARDALVKNELDKIGTEDAYAKGNQILMAGQVERQKLKAQAYQLAGERAVEDTIATRAVGGAGSGTYLKGLQAVAEEREAKRKIFGDQTKGAATAVSLPDGTVLHAADASEASKLRDQVDGSADVAALARSIKKDISNLSDRSDPETRARVLARLPALKIAISKQQGVSLRGAGEYLDAQVGSPEDLVNLRTNPGARLDAIAAEAEHKINVIRQHRLTSSPGAAGPSGAAPSERAEEE